MFSRANIMCTTKEGRAESSNIRFNSMDFFSGFVLPVFVSNWYENLCNLQRLCSCRIKNVRLNKSLQSTHQVSSCLFRYHVETPDVPLLFPESFRCSIFNVLCSSMIGVHCVSLPYRACRMCRYICHNFGLGSSG